MKSRLVWPKAPLSLENLVDHGAQKFVENHCFFGHGTDNPNDEALSLALHALDLSWDIDESALQHELQQSEIDSITRLFERRINERIPAAYITGQMFFAGLSFQVNSDVLVPRSPIAELIFAQFQPWLKYAPARILDLCTGSGCIGIACAKEFPDAAIVCSDISDAALRVAEANVEQHSLQSQVQVIKSDLFQELSGKFDLIVSNPPYVDANDLSSMPAEYSAEPSIGLAAGDDGLDIAKRILAEAGKYLSPNGLLVVEVGNSAEALEQTYPDVPFTWVEFAHGGQGVFVMSVDEIAAYASHFQV